MVLDPWVSKIPWSKKWQTTPVFLPGRLQEQRSLAGYSSWGHKESEAFTFPSVYNRLSTYFLHLHTVFPGRVTSPVLKMRKENWGSGKVNCSTESSGYCLPASRAKRTCPQRLLPLPPCSKVRAVSLSGYDPPTSLLMVYSFLAILSHS